MNAKVEISEDTASVSGKMASGAVADLSGATVKFSSSNEAIATVDETTGKITKVALYLQASKNVSLNT